MPSDDDKTSSHALTKEQQYLLSQIKNMVDMKGGELSHLWQKMRKNKP